MGTLWPSHSATSAQDTLPVYIMHTDLLATLKSGKPTKVLSSKYITTSRNKLNTLQNVRLDITKVKTKKKLVNYLMTRFFSSSNSFKLEDRLFGVLILTQNSLTIRYTRLVWFTLSLPVNIIPEL